MKFIAPLLLCGFLAGCALGPLKPGRVSYRSPDGTTVTTKQSQNPKTATTQTYKRTEESKDGKKTTEEINTVLGSAQKDTAREIGAKLASLRGVSWIGVLVFLFGAASFVYPPLKVIVGGSVTTSAVITLAGLSLIFLPTLIVGNEILILGVTLGSAVLYWFAHRHASVHATLKTILPK
jgi:hypothetical protein